MNYGAISECFLSDFHLLSVSLFLFFFRHLLGCVSPFPSEECCIAQWHDQTNPVQFLMNADKATDETDGV